MPTTIDSLQIEIRSSSDGAAQGIDNLAAALGRLKKNGSVNTQVKGLVALTGALKQFTSVSSNANKVSALADSLRKLKEVGSIKSMGTGISGLVSSLKSISSLDIDGIAPQIERVAAAVRPLSNIKGGGLSSMTNGLKKLGEVTKSLDDETIDAFAQKVGILVQKLEPLSQKMTTIKSGFAAISAGARSAGRATRDMGEDVDAARLNMSSLVTVIESVVGWFQQMVQAVSAVISESIEWDGIAARFGRGFGPQAEETYAWIQRLNEEMGINIQMFMKYSSVYATMLKGFGVAQEDASKMALGYTELTYDIWAGYNDVYKSFDEAAEAIKSAIAGEVEPVRRAGFTIVETSLAETAANAKLKESIDEVAESQSNLTEISEAGADAFKNLGSTYISDQTLQQTAANHGLAFSLETATEAEKSYLRYLTLVDQAHAQGLVGTYARELKTAEGYMRTFSQQLKSLAQAFGSLFLPAITMVMPYLSAFVELLADAVQWLAGLFGIKIQPVDWSGYNSGAADAQQNTEGVKDALGGAASAAKELKNATLGLDELNVISPPDPSGGGGGGGAAGSSPFEGWEVESLWDESIFKDIQNQVDELKEKWMGWLPVLGGIAAALAGWKLTNLLKDTDAAYSAVNKLGKIVTTVGIALAVGALVWDFTGSYLETADEKELIKALGTTTLGTAVAYFLAGKTGAAIVLATSGVVTLGRWLVEVSEGDVQWSSPESLTTLLVGGVETAIGGVLTWKTVGPILKKAWATLLPKLTAAIPKATAAISTFLAGGGGWVAAIVAAVVGALVLGFVDYDFTDVSTKIGEAIGNALKWAFLHIPIVWIFRETADYFKNEFDIETFSDFIETVFDPDTWTKTILPKVKEIAQNVWDGFIGFFDNLASNIGEIQEGLLEGFGNAFGVDLSWLEPITLDGYADWAALGNPLTGLFAGTYNIADAIVGGTTGKDLTERISDLWDEVRTWWSKKPPLSSYTPSIGSIKDKVVAAWDSAKNWWNDRKAKLKSYTPSIGSIYEPLKDRWNNAKDWWNNKKTKLKSYTPSIGSIYEPLKKRWDNAKDWWNRSKSAMKSYTPSIGSIKDKIVSAWNTAKKWWNSNAKLTTKLDIKTPKITIKWENVTVLGKTFRYPKDFDVKFAAAGGIFDAGSLVWAGEHGPEIVANASGGKTGVMNVQQMQDAVYEGVYAAVMAAQRSGGNENGGQSFNIYLDGRQVTATVEKRQRERGAAIMGNEVYSY